MTQSLYAWDWKSWLWNGLSLWLDFIKDTLRFLYDHNDQFHETYPLDKKQKQN